MVVDGDGNAVVLGADFELSLDDVDAFLSDEEAALKAALEANR